MTIKRISFLDILSLDRFKGYTIFDLLKPEMDDVVASYTYQLGADIKRPMVVQACKHRKLNKEPVISYCYVYYERSDKEWIKNSCATLEALIDSQEDLSLREELRRLSAQGGIYDTFIAKARDVKDSENGDNEPSYKDDLKTIQVLQDILQKVRGHVVVNDYELCEPV